MIRLASVFVLFSARNLLIFVIIFVFIKMY